VVELYPSEKWSESQLGWMEIPIWKVKIPWFQTTNQKIFDHREIPNLEQTNT
jgi:hypothetical protein